MERRREDDLEACRNAEGAYPDILYLTLIVSFGNACCCRRVVKYKFYYYLQLCEVMMLHKSSRLRLNLGRIVRDRLTMDMAILAFTKKIKEQQHTLACICIRLKAILDMSN